jgi:hypothetical protein
MSKNPMEQIAIYREANRQAAAVIMTARQRYPRMQIWADRVLNPKPNETFLGRNGLAIPEAEITLASTIDVTADHKGTEAANKNSLLLEAVMRKSEL